MAVYTYGQLEGFWIDAGGAPSLAPLMAAIAMAESRGNSDAQNPDDNNGTQSSFGLWQISTGTHIPPASNWQDPQVNAQLAVQKWKTQGLGAWGTYTSGAYKAFMKQGVPPDQTAHTTASGPGDWLGWLGQMLNGQGAMVPPPAGAGNLIMGIGSFGKVLTDIASPTFWKRIGKGAVGGGLVIGGVYLMMQKEGMHPVRQIENVGTKAATVAAVVPK